jgi:hypothetical protein
VIWIRKTDYETLQIGKMFQTSDTPTVSFKSQFRSEGIRNDPSEAFLKRHVVISNVTRFAEIAHMTLL